MKSTTAQFSDNMDESHDLFNCVLCQWFFNVGPNHIYYYVKKSFVSPSLLHLVHFVYLSPYVCTNRYPYPTLQMNEFGYCPGFRNLILRYMLWNVSQKQLKLYFIGNSEHKILWWQWTFSWSNLEVAFHQWCYTSRRIYITLHYSQRRRQELYIPRVLYRSLLYRLLKVIRWILALIFNM